MLSWNIKRPFGRTLGLSVLLLLGIIAICEALLRIEPIRRNFPTPTLSRTIMYPELDVKWTRLEEYARSRDVKCFILGSSMSESNIDPDILSAALEKTDGANPHCYNFGLTGFKMENSAALARMLQKQFQLEYIFIGISAVDFNPNSSDTRDVTTIPWFDAMLGRPSLDGWLAEHSMTYRSLSLLPKMRSKDYRNELKKSEETIQGNGFRINRGTHGITFGDIPRLPEYSINPYDLAGLDEILALEEQGVRVIVIEMPIMPEYFPMYVEGGAEGYQEKFLSPILKHLETQGSALILTQNEMMQILPAESWYNENHLNVEGAEIFSRWLAGRIGER